MLCVLTEFIEGVSQFSVKGDKLSKLRCKYSCMFLCIFFCSSCENATVKEYKNWSTFARVMWHNVRALFLRHSVVTA